MRDEQAAKTRAAGVRTPVRTDWRTLWRGFRTLMALGLEASPALFVYSSRSRPPTAC